MFTPQDIMDVFHERAHWALVWTDAANILQSAAEAYDLLHQLDYQPLPTSESDDLDAIGRLRYVRNHHKSLH